MNTELTEKTVTSHEGLAMLDMVAPLYSNSALAFFLFEAMGRELDRMTVPIEALTAEGFPTTATWGLAYWEERLGLSLVGSLEYRRQAVLNKLYRRMPMNSERLKAFVLRQADAKTGATADRVTVTELFDQLAVLVEATTQDKPYLAGDVKKGMRAVLPAHLALLWVMGMGYDIEVSHTARVQRLKRNMRLGTTWHLGVTPFAEPDGQEVILG